MAALRCATSKSNSFAGFTLFEVLIALAIVAVVAVQLSTVSSASTHTQEKLEQKTFAHWIAQNKLRSLRAQTTWPETGETTEEVEMARRVWMVSTKVSPAPLPAFRQIEVKVALLGLIGEPHLSKDQVVGSLARLQSLMTEGPLTIKNE